MKKQSLAALILLLLIPVVTVAGGVLFSLINPEIAAGHPNYVRNWQLLHALKMMSMWGSMACVGVLWIMACVLVIRSKGRSLQWLSLAALGPIGFAGVCGALWTTRSRPGPIDDHAMRSQATLQLSARKRVKRRAFDLASLRAARYLRSSTCAACVLEI